MEILGYDYFVGIDWASEKHDVCLIDSESKRLMEKDFANSVEGLQSLVQRLIAFSPLGSEKIAVAIEVPHGPVVESLVDQGFHVYAVNPKQLDRFRDRHTTAGAKDDRLDAFVLANSLRTDLQCFRRVKLAAADMIKLRELSRLNDELGVTLRRLSNQLLAQLMRFAPHLTKLCPAADKAWFWELLVMAIDPRDAVKVKPYKISKLLKSYRIRSLTSEEVHEAIKAPTLAVAPGVLDAAIRHIKVLLPQLTVVYEQKKELTAELKNLLESLMLSLEGKEGEHRDAAIILSLPGIGNVVAATMLSEASQAIEERNYQALRAQAGIAPVTKRSGKRCVVAMRYACNDRLRNALYYWTMSSVQNDPISKRKYAALRAKGHPHARALRSIGDGLLRVLFGMLKNGSVYELGRRQELVPRTISC